METKKLTLSGRNGIVSKYSYIFVFLIIFAVYAMTSSSLTWSGVMNIFRHSAIIGIIALGMGMICLTGEIDLSVGSMLAMVSGFSVVVYNITGSILAAFFFAIAFGGICGLINGALVGGAEMPAFIVTLATMLIFRSVSQYVCQHLPKDFIGGGSSIYKLFTQKESFQAFYQIGNGKFATVPYVGVVLALMAALFVYLSASTKYGKKVYAIGSNQKGAVMAGINVPLTKISVFVIAGMLVGLGAFLWIAMNASADPATTGTSYEMYAIAAVVLGGVSMSGGKGRVLGILFGAMSYTIIDKIIVALKMDSLINDAIKGVILLMVIMIQMAGPKVKSRLKK
jgi:ribose transport system permease protein